MLKITDIAVKELWTMLTKDDLPNTLEEAAKFFAVTCDARLVAITDGKDGSTLVVNRRAPYGGVAGHNSTSDDTGATDNNDDMITTFSPVHEGIKQIDSTGAGDAYFGGMIAALSRWGAPETVEDLDRVGYIASAAGAACCEVLGALPIPGISARRLAELGVETELLAEPSSRATSSDSPRSAGDSNKKPSTGVPLSAVTSQLDHSEASVSAADGPSASQALSQAAASAAATAAGAGTDAASSVSSSITADFHAIRDLREAVCASDSATRDAIVRVADEIARTSRYYQTAMSSTAHAIPPSTGPRKDLREERSVPLAARVFITGIGKSGAVADRCAMSLRSVGVPASFIPGSDWMHGCIGGIGEGDVLVAFSNSGNTTEIVDAVVLAKERGVKVYVVVGATASKLEALAANAVRHAWSHSEGQNIDPYTSYLPHTILWHFMPSYLYT